MKNLSIYISLVCLLLISAACNKGSSVSPDTNASLIAGKYTATKIEFSNDGTTWIDATGQTSLREILTVKTDKTYTSESLLITNSSIVPVVDGTWALVDNGNTLSLSAKGPIQTQGLSIISLSPTSMVMSYTGLYVNNQYSSNYQNFTKITFNRQ